MLKDTPVSYYFACGANFCHYYYVLWPKELPIFVWLALRAKALMALACWLLQMLPPPTKFCHSLRSICATLH